ncbi:MAG: DMT family transporter [Thermodesulfobacteriota bacterium]
MTQIKVRQMSGWLAVFSSAFFLYLSSAVIRWSESEVMIHPSFFLFSRYLVGFLVIAAVLMVKRERPVAHKPHLLAGRTVFNLLALLFFYKAVSVSTVAKANILNMTYPIFTVVFTWIFTRERFNPISLVLVLAAFTGIWLILSPGDLDLAVKNLWGLASGICATLALFFLSFCRKDHDTETILYYMFGMGALLVFILFPQEISLPDATRFYYLALFTFFSVLGTYLITLGYRYVTAVEGSIISSTRILLAALLGPFIVAGPRLTRADWIGALLIFVVNVFLAVRKASDADL